jgi:hypothetical protein
MHNNRYNLRNLQRRRLIFNDESDQVNLSIAMPDPNPDLSDQIRELQQQLEALRTNVPADRDESPRTHTRVSVHLPKFTLVCSSGAIIPFAPHSRRH